MSKLVPFAKAAHPGSAWSTDVERLRRVSSGANPRAEGATSSAGGGGVPSLGAAGSPGCSLEPRSWWKRIDAAAAADTARTSVCLLEEAAAQAPNLPLLLMAHEKKTLWQ